jgi:hypothetical protein
MSIRRFALIMCLMLPSWGWADNYLCVAERAVGFAVRGGVFQETFFNMNTKYLMSTEKRTLSFFGGDGPYVEDCDVATLVVNCDGPNIQFSIQR